MEFQQETANLICKICAHEFSSVSAKNRHLRTIHDEQVQETRKCRIKCPLCKENEFICKTYQKLNMHLEVSHNIKVQILTYNFSSNEMCEQWLEVNKIQTLYVTFRINRNSDHVEKNFMCKHSDSTGHKSVAIKRIPKAGGSIKMYGVCPSRLMVKFFETGQCTVKFWNTHVGHDEKIRTQHLLKADQSNVVEKFQDQGGDSVSGTVANLLEEEGSSKPNESQQIVLADKNVKKEIEIETFTNFLRSLDHDTLTKVFKETLTPLMERLQPSPSKRKIEKQDDFPTQRKK